MLMVTDAERKTLESLLRETLLDALGSFQNGRSQPKPGDGAAGRLGANACLDNQWGPVLGRPGFSHPNATASWRGYVPFAISNEEIPT
jgi:hypothetical protein